MDCSTFEDTIVAPATVPGTGAVTMIRVSGRDALGIVGKVVSCPSGQVEAAPANTIRYGLVRSEDGRVLDEVMVSVFRAPRSYTGEDFAEITCHASSYVASELMRLLCKAGARMASPGEFTRRAFVNGKMDLAQAEAVADVISSTGAASLRVAMNQLRGGYSSELKNLRTKLLEMASLLELELDFSEEDVQFADREKLTGLLNESRSRLLSLTDSFRYGNALKEGVPVVIAGAANSGKSTLLNSLLGEDRAIVSEIAGTTRDTVEETLTVEGVKFRFIDTAGLRPTDDAIESIGIERSYKKISQAAVVLAILDLTAGEEENGALISDIVSRIKPSEQKLIVLLNKVDILAPNINVSLLNNSVSSADEKVVKIYISAKTGFGLDLLKNELAKTQKDKTFDSDQAVVTNLRHYQALSEASVYLEKVSSGILSGTPTELLAEDLRQALNQLGTITGEVTSDDILGEIFSRFCIGK